MKYQNGFSDLIVPIILALIFLAIYWVVDLHPPGEWKAKDEQIKSVNEVLEKSQNQPFANEIKKLALKAQEDGKITQDEAELIKTEYDKQLIKHNINKLH